MVFESFAASYISKALGKFIKNIDPSKFKLSLLSGFNISVFLFNNLILSSILLFFKHWRLFHV